MAEAAEWYTEEDLEQIVMESKALQTYPVPEKVREVFDDNEEIPTYTPLTDKERLDEIVANNDVIVVAGAFFGDEGKGKLVDALAQYDSVTMVGRFNSGQNAGHTVTIDGKKHIFHLCPSSIMVEGIENYIGSECVMDPITFFNEEIKQLVDVVNYKDRLFIDNVHITTPYHRLMDLLRNLPDDVADMTNEELVMNNASTLQGIAPIHGSKVNKSGPRMDDILNGTDAELKNIYLSDMKAYEGMLLSRGIDEERLLSICEMINAKAKRIPDHLIDFIKAGMKKGEGRHVIDAEAKAQHLIDLYRQNITENELFPTITDTSVMIQNRLDKDEKLLIEASQSFYLSNRIWNFWRSATSPDTTGSGVAVDSGTNLTSHPERGNRHTVISIHKVPTSRVGRGENPGGFVNQTFYSDRKIDSLPELGDLCNDYEGIQRQFINSIGDNGLLRETIYQCTHTGKKMPITTAMAIAEAKEFSECGATTKKPRVTGIFDCVLNHKVMSQQGPYLSISAMDRYDNCEKIAIITGYVFHNPEGREVGSMSTKYKNGDIIEPGDAVPSERVLKYCQPIFKVIDGWKDNPIAADESNPDRHLKPDYVIPKGVQKFVATVEKATQADVISIGIGPEAHHLMYLKKPLDRAA